MRNVSRLLSILIALIWMNSHESSAQTNVEHGGRYDRLVVRNALIVDGNGTPAIGPFDIVVEGNSIVDLVPLDPVAVKSGTAKRPEGEYEIDASGKYVLPGLINAHGHIHESRGGIDQSLEYD